MDMEKKSKMVRSYDDMHTDDETRLVCRTELTMAFGDRIAIDGARHRTVEAAFLASLGEGYDMIEDRRWKYSLSRRA
jgi:hypothetical protein